MLSQGWKSNAFTLHGIVFFLLSLYIFSIPFSKSFWIPVVFLLALSPFCVFSRGGRLSEKGFRMLLFVYLFLFFPSIISLRDAYDFERGLIFIAKSFLVFLSIIPVYFYIREKGWDQISKIVLYCICLWSLSIYIQFLSGGYFFGEDVGGRYYGIFGPDNLIAGYAIIPWVGLGLYSIKSMRLKVLFLAFITAAIFASGNRAAWLSMTCFVFVFLMIYAYHSKHKMTIFFMALIFSLSFLFWAKESNNSLAERLRYTFGFVSELSFDNFNKSSAGRIKIWEDSLFMVEDNLIDGVGVRSFRFAYPDYSSNDDYIFEDEDGKKIGPYHAHQIIIQFLVDMGVLGGVAIIGIYSYFFYATFLIAKIRYDYAIPVLGFAASILPINTHLNIFGGYLLVNFFLIMAMTFGAMQYYSGSRFERKEAS